ELASLSQEAICETCEPGDDTGGGGGGSGGSFPVITFWEGNDCTQDQVGWYPATSLPMNIPNTSGSGWVNDEARSMRLFNIQAGTVIRVYDSSSGSTSAPWAEITVNRFIANRCIYSFQVPWCDADYKLDLRYRGTLDGKVSLVRVTTGSAASCQ
ncbi:MAG TPA: hypothetical protein VEZ71_08960, partial [Archangium sp.]|nr:hypothetical protein [Archangium sp.]